MVVSAKNSSSSTPVRSRVNVSPVRISVPAACSHTSREAMRCGTCSAQRTAHSAQRNGITHSAQHSVQRTAHSITHSAQRTASLTAACRADTPRVDHMRMLGCPRGARALDHRPEERPALPVTSTTRHGTARHVRITCSVQWRDGMPTSCQHRIARCPAHSPAARCHTRHACRTGWLSFCALCALASACALHKSAASRGLLRGHARTHALFAALLAPTDSREDRLLRSSRRILTTRQRIATDSRALCPSQRLVPPRSAVRPLAPPAATWVRGGRRSPPKWHTRSLGVNTSIPCRQTRPNGRS